MKKGFTLIELLAVIVILAIIAVIAVPIVLNIIKDSKESAILRSAEFYLKGVEQSVAQATLKEQKIEPREYSIMNDGNICLGTFTEDICVGIDNRENNENDILKVEVNGEVPNSGTITIENGKVKEVNLTYPNGNITKNEKGQLAYKTIPAPVSFSEDSWETIVANVKAGNFSAYNVGDTKEIALTGYTNGEADSNGLYTIRIANTPTITDEEEEKCGTEGFSETACGFVIEFVDIIIKHGMNDTSTNKDGWPASAMRQFVTPVEGKEGSGTIYNALPEELRINIIDTTVVSGRESGKSANYISTDKLYLLSTKEVHGTASSTDKLVNETRQLDYYKNIGVTSSNCSGAIKNLDGSASDWWIRSAESSYTTAFILVQPSGSDGSNFATSVRGVAVAFRIG